MDLDTRFNNIKDSYKRHPYPSLAERKNALRKLKTLLQKEAKAIAKAIDDDYKGRVSTESYLLELYPAIQAINYNLRHLSRWMRAKRRALSVWLKPAKARILPQPLGVVGIVVPWNYPLYLTISPLVSAISAGNVAMIKMSEDSEVLGELLINLFKKYNINNVDIVTGDVNVAKAFCALPFNHLLYTGSTAVGRSVMGQASQTLTPVTLELGGKSPVIIDKDVKMAKLERLFMGKFFNAGQTCVAPDHVYLHQDKKDEFVALAKSFVANHYPQLNAGKDYTTIINDRRYHHLQALKQQAIKDGAECVSLGQDDEKSKIMSPSLLFNVNDDMAIMQEEIFGPLMPVMFYHDMEEVIARINQQDRPLALYYFGGDKGHIQQLIENTHSGGVTVNDTLMHVVSDNLPFGGVGQSGMGHYHGEHGFNTFSKLKPIFYQSNFSSFSLLYPPYKSFVRLFLKKVAGLDI